MFASVVMKCMQLSMQRVFGNVDNFYCKLICQLPFLGFTIKIEHHYAVPIGRWGETSLYKLECWYSCNVYWETDLVFFLLKWFNDFMHFIKHFSLCQRSQCQNQVRFKPKFAKTNLTLVPYKSKVVEINSSSLVYSILIQISKWESVDHI